MIIYEQAKEEPLVIGKYGIDASYSSMDDYFSKFSCSLLDGYICLKKNNCCGCLPINTNFYSNNSFGMSLRGSESLTIYCSRVVTALANFFGYCSSGFFYQCDYSYGSQSGQLTSRFYPFNSIFVNNLNNDFLIELCMCAVCRTKIILTSSGCNFLVACSCCVPICLSKCGAECGFIFLGTFYCGPYIEFCGCNSDYCTFNGAIYPYCVKVISGNVKFLTELCG